MSDFPTSMVLVGGGKMGFAMLQGWLAHGLQGRAVSVIDPHPSETLKNAAGTSGFLINPDIASIAHPEVLILAVKPQMLDSAAEMLAALAGPRTLVISVLAGKTIANLAARMPHSNTFVRAMPNTPAAVGRGITGVAFSQAVTKNQAGLAIKLLGAVGKVIALDNESLIDCVTAVSGSGPAYVFHMVESLAAAGEASGLPADIALQLARATIEGAGELLYREPSTPADELRRNVTSPGGTTAAALEVLMAGEGLTALMTRAVAAAKRRAGELSG